jgi:hypothetical protein
VKRTQKVKKQREITAKTPEVSKLVSRAYSLSHAVAELLLTKPEGYVKSDYRLHHLDANVFNCSPFNLVFVKHKDHEEIHSKLPRINSTEVANILLHKPELVEKAQKEYFEGLESNEDPASLVDRFFLDVVQNYRIQNYTTLDIEELFADLDNLKIKFMTMGPKTFGQKVFRVRGKTALRACFDDYDYADVFDAWLEEAKADHRISDSEVFGRK